jgi:glutamyl-tRNA synthetase
MLVNGRTLVRTRFAPSPTGYLHIGGVRTAIFNYLFAKKYDGAFVLRIDDTDKSRNVDSAIKPIIDGLNWLGLEWDEGPIHQSNRNQHYRDIAVALIKTGDAYPDNCAGDGRRAYRGTHRNCSPEQNYGLWDDTGWSIRFKVPDNEKIVLDDMIRGKVTWDTSLLSDPVIFRSNGTATYNFATAVDDCEMKISHVIRAEEHLSNTPLQLLIMDALGYMPPMYAHLPFVCEPNSNKKLSKRDCLKFLDPEIMAKLKELGFSASEITTREELNPVSLSYYDCLGYKPSAVFNYLVRLGWSLDGETEIIKVKDLKTLFDLKRVNTSPARFDPKKMLWVNHEHVKEDSNDVKTIKCLSFLKEAKVIQDPTPLDLEKTRVVVDLCGDRIKCYSDIIKYGAFFFRKPKYPQNEVDKYLGRTMIETLESLVQIWDLNVKTEWTAKEIESHLKDFMTVRGQETKEIIAALRVCVCGCNVGPSLWESLEILGKKETIERVKMA